MTKKYDYRITDERTSFKPFNYPWAYNAWLAHEQSHWLHTEVPMAEDVIGRINFSIQKFQWLKM
jgi:ribonucleotide reductase beta subunit family protein with ferritin-like domain